jgi:hypothetical protein
MLSRSVLFGVFFICSVALSHAHPLDGPDIVYIDGVPCNKACQSYMAWSREVLSRRSAPAQSDIAAPRAPAAAPLKPKTIVRDHRAPVRTAATASSKTRSDSKSEKIKSENIARIPQQKGSTVPVPAGNPVNRVSRQIPKPALPDAPPSITATTENTATPSAATPSTASADATSPDLSNQNSANLDRSNPDPVEPSASASADNKPTDNAASAQPADRPASEAPVDAPAERTAALQQPELGTPPNSTTVAVPAEPSAKADPDASSKTEAALKSEAAGSKPEPGIKAGGEFKTEARAVSKANTQAAGGTRRFQDQVTAATTLAEQLTSTLAAHPELHAMNGTSPNVTGSADRNAVPSPGIPEASVAVVLSRPDIKKVADLAGKNVAIDGKRSGSVNDIRIALVAAGAGEVRVSADQAKALERLVSGEVPAAVLTLVSPDAAETFPDIPGYKVFRVPLSPATSKTP